MSTAYKVFASISLILSLSFGLLWMWTAIDKVDIVLVYSVSGVEKSHFGLWFSVLEVVLCSCSFWVAIKAFVNDRERVEEQKDNTKNIEELSRVIEEHQRQIKIEKSN